MYMVQWNFLKNNENVIIFYLSSTSFSEILDIFFMQQLSFLFQ